MTRPKSGLTVPAALAALLFVVGCGGDDADTSPEGIRTCLTEAGAAIAETPNELGSARRAQVGVNAEVESAAQIGSLAVYEVRPTEESDTWRLFFGVPDGRDLNLGNALADPRSVPLVAVMESPSEDEAAAASECVRGEFG